MHKLPTQARVKEMFSYDPDTGYFYWLDCRNSKLNGKRTGVGVGSHGYHQLYIDGTVCLLHRVAWLYVMGKWPKDSVDHKNGNPRDNRFKNLREANAAQQLANAAKRSDNSTGFKGVSWSVCSKAWRARIQIDGKGRQIGVYKTKEEAHSAYIAEASRHFGEFARSA